MTPVEFEGQTTIYAKDQREYLPLPAHVDHSGPKIVTTCWELSREEIELLLLTKRIWLQQYTFGEPLQPQLPSVDKPRQVR